VLAEVSLARGNQIRDGYVSIEHARISMPSQGWKQIEEIYQSALKLDSAGRSELLARLDPELRREIEVLLDQDETVATETLLESLTWLGPYRIETKLGEGGMGEVYRAFDTRLRRTVAIKILPQDKVTDVEYKRRFLKEARAASALNHPNIVTVHDIARDHEIDYLVMELITGQTLKQLIPAGGLPIDEIVGYGVQIASALAAAHGAGIVHRDIKPANIMVNSGQQVKVLDFGIAKRVWMLGGGATGETQVATQSTIPGMIVGTVAYMSPEQTRGEPVDSRSDIFSLGCVLYQAATGRLPFHGDSALATMQAIATARPPNPSSLNPKIPSSFDRLIGNCLEKQPDRRLANAAEVATELKLLLSVQQPVRQAHTDRAAVAVIPFHLRTGNQEDQFLSVALADAVIHRLASTGKLLVRPMASVLRYKDTETEWTQIAHDLNVDLVVQGAIQKVGARVRVSVQVFRLSDSRVLHSAKFEGDGQDLFGLEDRIADSVSDVFVPREKAAAEPANPPTSHPLAYELYLRAVDRLAHMDKFDTGSAIETLGRVVDLDPNFADAWGRLAQACTQMGMHFDPDPQWFERAENAIAKTLELDPVQCDALCARGQILWSPSRSFQNRAALRAIYASLKVNPTRDAARQFRSAILFHLGFYDQADRDVEEVLLRYPGHVLSVHSRGMVALYRGDYEVSNDFIARALSLNPAGVHSNLFFACPAIFMGRLDVARDRIRKARQMIPEEPELLAQEGLILAHEGNFSGAEELADQALESKRSLTHTHHVWHDAAGVYAMCGKPEKAILQLRRCGDMGLPNYLLFQRDPHLSNLRGDPDFQVLMTELRREYDRFQEEFGLSAEIQQA
jgi:serine/threonine protein kinase/tetratricopeptide (TPR) repeat protein